MENADKYSFEEQLRLGQKYEAELDAFFSQYLTVQSVPLHIQKMGIDRIFTRKLPPKNKFSVEYKADLKASETNNAYIETLSNSRSGALGWAKTSLSQRLIYYLPQRKEAWIMATMAIKNSLPFWEKHFSKVKCQNEDYYGEGLLVPLEELRKQASRIFEIQFVRAREFRE